MAKKTTIPEVAPELQIANDGLPSAPTKQTVNPLQMRKLLIAPPGWGKTTYFMNYPDALLLAFEEGHMFVEGYKIIIDRWMGKDEGVDEAGNMHMSAELALERILASDRFPFIIMDTVDAASKMCADHFIEREKAEHISELGDYGKGYELAQNTPMRKFCNAILKSGRGIGYITHQKIVEAKNKKGEIVSVKKASSMPEGILKNLYPQVDVILHGEFGGTPEGSMHRQRIIRTEGSEELLAKNRGGKFPPAFIVPEDGQASWDQLAGFFTTPETVNTAYAEYKALYEE